MKTLSVSKIVGFFPLRKDAAGGVEAFNTCIYVDSRSSLKMTTRHVPSIGSGARLNGIFRFKTTFLGSFETALSRSIRVLRTIRAYCVRLNALFASGCQADLPLYGYSASKSLSGSVVCKSVNGGVCLAEGLLTHTTNDFGETDTGLRLYPNPASSTTLIQLDALLPEGRLDVFNTDGRLVLRMAISDPLTPLDLSGWPNGMYVLRYGNDRTSVVKHVIKQ